jgi:hypothetical protein
MIFIKTVFALYFAAIALAAPAAPSNLKDGLGADIDSLRKSFSNTRPMSTS